MADAEALANVYDDPEVVRFLEPLDLDGTRRELASMQAEWAEHGYGILAVLDVQTGEFIGRSGLHYWPQWDEVETGWVIRRNLWGRGYATEAGAASLQWGFEKFGLNLITAIIANLNHRSIAVAERLGMTPIREEVLGGREVAVYAKRAL